MATTVFLFAHQDDEIGAFESIRRSASSGHKVLVIYLTNGNWKGTSSTRRNKESLSVLSRLGVSEDCVMFVGGELSIPDGELPAHLSRAFEAVCERLTNETGFERIMMLAWEGGHQDHDAANALGQVLARQYGVVDQSRQYSLYRSSNSSVLPFTIFNPLPENGPSECSPIPFLWRTRYLGFLLTYRSQWRVILFLFFPVAYHYLRHGKEFAQPISMRRLKAKPHDGTLLYERRGRYSFSKLSAKIDDFLTNL